MTGIVVDQKFQLSMSTVCMPCMIAAVENTCVMCLVLNLTFHSCVGVPTVKEKGFTCHLCIFDMKAVAAEA